MITVTLYMRKDCQLCEQARTDLAALREKYPHRLIEVDAEADPVFREAYGLEVPIVEAGPYRLKAPFTRQDLMMTLGAASDRRTQLERVDQEGYQALLRRGHTVTRSDRFSFWLSRHYLAALNLFMLLYVGLPFLAPVLMKTGATAPANVIYTVYSPLCHQLGFRSWYLFGAQAFYPRAAAGSAGVETFEQATGITDILGARAFRGDGEIGYKVALCERDAAIYAAMLLFGLLYGLTGRRMKPLYWLLWVLIGLAPVGLDGFSQLISQFQLPALASVLPYRESTPLLRTLTGFLFGFTTAWFGYPYVEETMRETRQFYIKKFAAADTTG